MRSALVCERPSQEYPEVARPSSALTTRELVLGDLAGLYTLRRVISEAPPPIFYGEWRLEESGRYRLEYGVSLREGKGALLCVEEGTCALEEAAWNHDLFAGPIGGGVLVFRPPLQTERWSAFDLFHCYDRSQGRLAAVLAVRMDLGRHGPAVLQWQKSFEDFHHNGRRSQFKAG